MKSTDGSASPKEWGELFAVRYRCVTRKFAPENAIEYGSRPMGHPAERNTIHIYYKFH
jgi:hypothetical protein